MKKEDNQWHIGDKFQRENSQGNSIWHRWVEINGEKYLVSPEAACTNHAILLLVDAINDKSINGIEKTQDLEKFTDKIEYLAEMVHELGVEIYKYRNQE